MGYIENQLAAGERILFSTHRAVSIGSILILALLGIVLIGAWPVGTMIGLSIFLGIVLHLMAIRSSEFVVTNRRVVIKLGMLSIRTIEMNLDKIESVEVVQPFFRARRSSGDVRLIGSGATRETFKSIMNALEFRRAVQEARDLRLHSAAS